MQTNLPGLSAKIPWYQRPFSTLDGAYRSENTSNTSIFAPVFFSWGKIFNFYVQLSHRPFLQKRAHLVLPMIHEIWTCEPLKSRSSSRGHLRENVTLIISLWLVISTEVCAYSNPVWKRSRPESGYVQTLIFGRYNIYLSRNMQQSEV